MSNFDRITGWPHHPAVLLALGFIGCFAAAMQGGGPIWAALIAAAIGAPFAWLLLFAPYTFSVWVLAVLLALPPAIRSALRRPAPTAR